MKHTVLPIVDFDDFREDLSRWVTAHREDARQPVLVQIYATKKSQDWLLGVSAIVEEWLPRASVVGCMAMGTIYTDGVLAGEAVASLFVFEHSKFEVILCPVPLCNEHNIGKSLWDKISVNHPDIKGILCFISAIAIDAESLLKGLSDPNASVPVFGAIAGDDIEKQPSFVFYNRQFLSYGVVLIAFSGESLRIKTTNYLGWLPFGEEMMVTEANNYELVSINHQPAFDFYQHFTGIGLDDFFDNAIEFPFVVNRHGIQIARVPVWVNGSKMRFLAGFERGDRMQFGYGDISAIFSNLAYSHHYLRKFKPEAIAIYSCCSRMFFLKEDSGRVLNQYKDIAPATGFFTLGEIDTANSGPNILNATILTVAFSEQPIHELDDTLQSDDTDGVRPEKSDDLRRLNRLMRFVTRMTEQLFETNRRLKVLAERDELTGAYNRRVLSQKLADSIEQAKRDGTQLCICMFDIDFFKRINDNFGHLTGDEVLKALADLVQQACRPGDLFARYGGEEFVMILPDTWLKNALEIAERIRCRIEQDFAAQASDIMPAVTCSFGVAELDRGHDNSERLLKRADTALYAAKSHGRNRVETG